MAASASTTGESFSSINVTPFVDVVLVLLVIFMATTSYLASSAIEVDLPEAASGGEVLETTLAVVLAADGRLYLDGEPSTEERLASRCRQVSVQNPKVQAMIAADGASPHRQVVHLIDVVKQNGVNNFALNIDSREPQDRE